MPKKEKFLRTHSERVKLADEYRKQSSESINIIDREALVEKYLLMDVKRMYEFRLKSTIIKRDNSKTKMGKTALEAQISQFCGIVDSYTELIDICDALIIAGRYKDVWKNIPETQIYLFSKNSKNLKLFLELSNKMYDDILKAGYDLEQERAKSEEERQNIENKYANLRAVCRASFDSSLNVAESREEYLEASPSYQEAISSINKNKTEVIENKESIIEQAKKRNNIKPNF